VQDWPHDDNDAGRHLILHRPHSGTLISTKPTNCVFYSYNTPIDARVPTEEQSATWFGLLAEDFPKSLQRFEALIDKEPAKNSQRKA
jgi:hypothetical protein